MPPAGASKAQYMSAVWAQDEKQQQVKRTGNAQEFSAADRGAFHGTGQLAIPAALSSSAAGPARAVPRVPRTWLRTSWPAAFTRHLCLAHHVTSPYDRVFRSPCMMCLPSARRRVYPVV